LPGEERAPPLEERPFEELRELPPLRLLAELRAPALLLFDTLRLPPLRLFEGLPLFGVRVLLRPPALLPDDEPPLLPRLRAGSFLRVTLAMLRSSSSLIDSAICLDAPLRLDLDRSPRLADNAAPAAICCLPDLAFGMEPSSVHAPDQAERRASNLVLPQRLRGEF
jgi:hypothetical protein